MSDSLRYLAAAGSGTDYVTSTARAIDPLPVVENDVLEHLAARAQRRDRERELKRAGERAQLPIAVRLERARAQARLKGIDVRGEIRVVRLAMQAGRSSAYVERRLRNLEARVFPVAA